MLRHEHLRMLTDWKANLLAVFFVAAMGGLGEHYSLTLLLFPELGALAHGVLARPNHPWASDLIRLIATPTITGIIGMLTMRYLGWGPVQVLLVLIISLGVVAVLQSRVLPALSAGVLPLVLGLSDWIYPICILTSCAALASVVFIMRFAAPPPQNHSGHSRANDWWHPGLLFIYLCFMALIATVAYWLSQPLLLFPPLAVLAFESLVRSETCPWIGRPIALVGLFVFCSAFGYGIFYVLGISELAVALSMIVAIASMTVVDLYSPPAIAISILPYASIQAGWLYPLEIGLSVAALAAVFSFIEWRNIAREGRMALQPRE
jgi:hypothetical protein